MESNEIKIKKIKKISEKDIKKSKLKRPLFLKLFLLTFFVLSLVLGFLYYKADKEVKFLSDPKNQALYIENQMQKVIKKIGEYVLLKDDDKLVYRATVQNPEILRKDELFFTDSSVGDLVFVFEKSQRVILWNPEGNKIINFGIINKQDNLNTPEENTDIDTAVKKASTSTPEQKKK